MEYYIIYLAFKELKNLVCKAPSLVLSDPSNPFQVETNASDYAIGAFLYQDSKPIAFDSKNLILLSVNISCKKRN